MLIDYRVKYGSNIVALIKVGLNGDTAGYNDKYIKMADDIFKATGYTVIVAPNPEVGGNKLDADIKAIEKFIPGCNEIHYIGVSNGAIMGMRYAYLYPKIKEMLLINGPLMLDWHKLKKGITAFEGDRITFIYGSKDPSYKYSQLIPMIDAKADIELKIVDGADHNFKGMENEFIGFPCKYLFNAR